MAREQNYIEPFGTQEFFCTGAIFEVAAPGVVRVLMVAQENGESVLKTRLLLPFGSLPGCIAGAVSFSTAQLISAVEMCQPLRMM